MAEKITERLYWIGTDAPDSRDFHGISTSKGGSYNSYLIKGEESVLIDTTNTKYKERFLGSLKEVIDPKKIKYIIINHAENDHAGAIKDICLECSNAKIICTKKCMEFIKEAFNPKVEYILVADNSEMKIGEYNFKFITDPMVHWPETMMTYIESNIIKEKTWLFSGDLFATEISHKYPFSDKFEDYTKLTRDYFALVMRPFNTSVEKAIEKIKNLDIGILFPSHGPAYRKKQGGKNIEWIIEYYKKLATNPEDNKIAIIYGSIWHGCEEIAKYIKEEIESNSEKQAVLLDITKENPVTIMAEAMTSKALCLGSLTILGSYHPMFETLFWFLKKNNQKGKKCAIFGTYGWVSASVKKMENKIQEELKYEIIGKLDIRFSIKNKEDKNKIKKLAHKIAELP